jgi:chemotaxis protein methyltransferase WspC
VKFFEGNLLSSNFAAGQPSYDFIFCRNLLIYFDRPTQQKALEKLEGLLAPGGILFVGPAEQPLALEHGFVSANIAKAFACRKAAAEADSKQAAEEWRMPMRLPVAYSPPIGESTTALGKVHAGHAIDLAAIGQTTAQAGGLPVVPDLEMARQFADAGRLQDAELICEQHLATDSDSAQGWYLLGLIRDACGDTSAVDCYRRALYLKPDHYETLLQMALWLQKNGESGRARTFKARAERAKPQPGNSTENPNARYA